jgi:hypothetical protein
MDSQVKGFKLPDYPWSVDLVEASQPFRFLCDGSNPCLGVQYSVSQCRVLSVPVRVSHLRGSVGDVRIR